MTSMFFRRALIACVALFAAREPIAAQMDRMDMSRMHMAPDPLGVSMDRFGSGTTWVPDAVSLPAYRTMAGDWSLMAHGFAFLQADAQGGPRGGAQLGSLNWGMFMASHELAGGRFQARTMLSLDAAGVGTNGYPLLLQTGESLHDRQHPHDLWMELGAMYERPVTSSLGVFTYAAPSGEPALGPVAFMHRPSAMDLPEAPISHHWQDATHISFGVVTAGVFGNKWKLEGSSFNGREPDSNRWDFDHVQLGSSSGRLTLNPSANWSFTAGYGFIHSPEADQPNQSLHRVVASALHGAPIGRSGQWTTTVVWGANVYPDQPLRHSVLLESEAVLDNTNSFVSRAEWLQQQTNVGEITVGYVREIAHFASSTTLGLGVTGTTNFVPATLRADYGSRTPVGGMIFLRLRPSFRR